MTDTAPSGTEVGGKQENIELFPGLPPCGLRDDLCFLDAALSYYDGGPAQDDVRSAWKRVTEHLMEFRGSVLFPHPAPRGRNGVST